MNTRSTEVRKCPYCGHEYKPESGDFNDSPYVEECEECHMKYLAYDEVEIIHHARRDCEANGKQHFSIGGVLCSECGKFMRARDENP